MPYKEIEIDRCEPYQVCTNDESGLTLIFFMARPNLKNLEMFIFLYNC